MSSMSIPELVLTPTELPFVIPKMDSSALLWEGIFAFYSQLNLVEPDQVPTGQWSTENIVLYLSYEACMLDFHDGTHWRKEVSRSEGLFFYPRNHTIKMLWSKPAYFVSFGVARDVLNQTAVEIWYGDPEHTTFSPLGRFDDPLLTEIGKTFLELLYNTDLSARLYAKSLGVALEHHLLYRYGVRHTDRTVSAPAELSDHQLQAILDYIQANYQANLSLAEIAASAGFSIPHFSRLFRAATGYSPYQYLIHCRIQQAYILLKQTKYNITEISQMVGFYDQSHLLRHFKRAYGISPSKVRT
jgi:AraC family transcriptional regulator